MKTLFLLLVLVNAIYFLWQFHSGNVNLPAAQQQYSQQLLTVNEYAKAQRGTEIARIIDQNIETWQQADLAGILADLHPIEWRMKAQQLVVKAPTPAESPKEEVVQAKPLLAPVEPIVRKCFEAGPFAEEAEAKSWVVQKHLTSKQILSRKIVLSSDIQLYFPAAKDMEQTLANKMMLKDKGLQGVWMIPEGEKKGAFSLGVFKDRARALVFKAQLAAQGIASEIWQREKTETQWFAKIMLDQAAVKKLNAQAVKLAECSRN